MRSDASGSVRTVAFMPYTGEAPGAENLRNPRNVRSQGLTQLPASPVPELILPVPSVAKINAQIQTEMKNENKN